MSRLIAALLILALVLAIAEIGFRRSGLCRGLALEHRYSALPLRFAESSFDPEIVILGDSRTMCGVRPTVIERIARRALNQDLRAFNLGMMIGAPVTMLAWVDHLLQRQQPPKLAVVQVSPFMFSTRLSPLARESIVSTYTPRGGWHALRAGMPFEDVLQIAATNLFSSMRHRRRILEILREGGSARPPEYLGEQGWMPGNRRISLPVQRERALVLARGYAEQQSRPGASFNREEYGYLDAAIRLLRRAGVGVVLVSTPVSSSLWVNDTDRTIFPEYMQKMRLLAARHGIRFYDHRRAPVLSDFHYADGEHLNPDGALRYTAFLTHDAILPFFTGRSAERIVRWDAPEPSAGCRVLFDFEALEPKDWSFEGAAFQPGVATGALGAQAEVTGYGGMQLLSSFSPESGDQATGVAVSEPFRISEPSLRFRIGGGNRPGVRLELLVDGEESMEATGNDSESLAPSSFDVGPYLERSARLRVVDEDTAPLGHLLVDQIELCAK